jgi:hypothetical protein
MQYLFIVDYDSDAERKRIDYTIERWSEKAKLKKPKGTVLLFESSNVDEFIEDLYARLDTDAEKVKVYRMEAYEPEVEKQSRKLVYESMEPLEALQSFLNYLMSKLGANFEYSTENTSHYTAYTKKGQAQLEIFWKDHISEGKEKGKSLSFIVLVEGYGNVVDFIADKLDEEIKIFLGK